MSRPNEPPVWRRSSECASSSCVEVARIPGHYLIRDTKNPESPPLSFTDDEWNTFVRAVKRDEFQ